MVIKGVVKQPQRESPAIMRGFTYVVCDVVFNGAGDEIRTRDIYLGKVVLYQLSYSREVGIINQ